MFHENILWIPLFPCRFCKMFGTHKLHNHHTCENFGRLKSFSNTLLANAFKRIILGPLFACQHVRNNNQYSKRPKMKRNRNEIPHFNWNKIDQFRIEFTLFLCADKFKGIFSFIKKTMVVHLVHKMRTIILRMNISI